MNPLSPEYVLFFVSLLAGILLMAVNAAGGVDHGADHDHDLDGDGVPDHDVDHDAGHDHEGGGLFGRALSMMGLGKVPLLLVLMVYLTIFGVLGIFLNLALSKYFPPAIYGGISFFASACISPLVTSVLARRLSQVMPKTESYNVSKYDLVGTSGTAVYTVDGTSGTVQVRDKIGDIFKIQARTTGGAIIPMGRDIIVLSYDEEQDHFVVFEPNK